MTDKDLNKEICAIGQQRFVDSRLRDVLLELATRAGVKLEPDEPCKDRFDEAAEKMLVTAYSNEGILITTLETGPLQSSCSVMCHGATGFVQFGRSCIAAAIRAEAAKGEGKLKRVREMVAHLRQNGGLHESHAQEIYRLAELP